MKFREAKKSELPEVADIFMCGTNSPPYSENWNKRTALLKIKDHIKNKSKVYIAIIDKKIIGFITARLEYLDNGGKIFVEEFYIRKQFQGQGIGTFMLAELERVYKGKIKSIALMSSKDSQAFKFYLKKGFKPYHQVIFMKKRIK